MISIVSVIPYSLDAYGLKVLERNQFSCRFWTFLSYFMPANTSWLLVFISIDRLYGIRNQNRRYTFVFQLIIVVLILIWNFIIYFCFIIYYDVITVRSSNSSNETIEVNTYCSMPDSNAEFILPLIDLINSLLLPFCIMMLCTMLIIKSIYMTRKKLLQHQSEKDARKLKKDIRFSLIIIFINILFFVFNFPMCMFNFFNNQTDNNVLYSLLNDFFNCQYLINIFIYSCFNLQFRRELLRLLQLKPPSKSTTNRKSTIQS